jgi:hypothetical protein
VPGDIGVLQEEDERCTHETGCVMILISYVGCWMGQEHQDDDQRLAVELAETMLATVAPEEVTILPEVSEEYFNDPEGSLKGAREESLGFGVELALLAPFAIAVAMEVVKFLLQLAKDALGPQVQSGFAAWVRRTFPGSAKATAPTAAAAPSPLTREQLQMVRGVAYAKAQALGLNEQQAGSLADAVVGGAALAGPGATSP